MGKGYDLAVEGKARIAVPKYSGKDVPSAMPVFYNPVMRSNRDITITLMRAAKHLYGIKKWQVADPMAASGIRSIRMLLELGMRNIESVAMNDYSQAAITAIKKNLRLNRITGKKTTITRIEANKFLLMSRPFNYIDIDPFGYPGIFLDAAVKRLQRNGILAVTATDTSALAGTAPDACRRKYLATPIKNSSMHETGLRIMVRLVQLIGAMHEKALTPVFSYSKEHYARAFFRCAAGAHRVDELLRQHNELLFCSRCCEKRIRQEDGNDALKCGNCGARMGAAGPLWTGALFDAQLAKAMSERAAGNKLVDERTTAFLKVIVQEADDEKQCGPGFAAIEEVCERHKIAQQPKTSDVTKRLRKAGYAASPTHCTTTGVKTNAPINEVIAAVTDTNTKFIRLARQKQQEDRSKRGKA